MVVKTGDHAQRSALNRARYSELYAGCLIAPLSVDQSLPGHGDHRICRESVTIQQVGHVNAQQVTDRRRRAANVDVTRRFLCGDPQLLTVAKLQFFNVEQAVSAVIQVQGSIRRCMVNPKATVRHTGKGIVSADIAIHRNVSFGAVTFTQDLTHDRQLVRFQGAGQHVRLQLSHALCAGESGHAGDGNTHVQPGIAINDVVTRFTHNTVAAATTEDDVAAVIRIQQHRIRVRGALDAENGL